MRGACAEARRARQRYRHVAIHMGRALDVVPQLLTLCGLRYREALGDDIGEIPSGFYPGEYLKEVGQALAERDGRRWLDAPEAEWLPVLRDFSVATIMGWIREDLAALGVASQVFTSERSLVQSGAVDAALKSLEDKGLIYVGVLEPPKGKQPDPSLANITVRQLLQHSGGWDAAVNDPLLMAPDAARATTWTVTSTGDGPPSPAHCTSAGNCSERRVRPHGCSRGMAGKSEPTRTCVWPTRSIRKRKARRSNTNPS